MTVEDRIAKILAPAIDCRAPYAKFMIKAIAGLLADTNASEMTDAAILYEFSRRVQEGRINLKASVDQ